MKKNFLKKISLLVAMLMCISSLGVVNVFAASDFSAYVLPSDTVGDATHSLGDFDDYLASENIGEGATVSDTTKGLRTSGGSNWSGLVPGKAAWSSGSYYAWTNWQLVKISEGNGGLKTLSTADNAKFFRSANLGANPISGTKKFETKIKFDDADACTVMVGNSGQVADCVWYANNGIFGVSFVNGVVTVGGTEVALAEALSDGTWYKVDNYIDFDNNKVRAVIYKETEEGKLYPIADSGANWISISRNSSSDRGIGIYAVCGATSNITVDYFKAYNVTNIASPVSITDDGYVLTLSFSGDVTASDINDIEYAIAGVDDVTAVSVYDADTNTATVTFNASLDYETEYDLVITSGGNTISVPFVSENYPADVASAFLVPTYNQGAATATLGNFDEYLTTYGEGTKVSDGGGFKSDLFTVLLPGGASWGANYQKKDTEWQLIKLADGNGAIKTVSNANNTWFFRGNNFGKAWLEEMSGIKKVETQIKFDDATACTVYATVNYQGRAGGFNRAETGWDGLIFEYGTPTLGGTTIELSEEIQNDTWYKTETYFDFDNNKARAIIYKIAEDGKAYPIADSGEEWVSVTRQTNYSGIGIGATCNPTSNITVDYFNTYDVSDMQTVKIDEENITENNEFTLGFSRKLSQDEVNGIAFTLDGVNDFEVTKSFDEDANTLNVKFNASIEYETDYEIIVSGNAIKSCVVPFTTGIHPQEAFRPILTGVTKEVYSASTSAIGDFDQYLTTYGDGNSFASDIFSVLLPGGSNWGAAYQKPRTKWKVVDLGNGNGAMKTMSTADNTYFFYGHNIGTAYDQDMNGKGIKKFETKIMLDDADNCKVYPTLNHRGYAGGYNWADKGWCGLEIENGVVTLGSQSTINADFTGTTLTLSEALQDNTWYKTETYFDFDNSTAKAVIYKLANDGTETKIADSGDEWVAVSRLTTFSGISLAAICGANSNVTVDYFNKCDVSYGGTLADEVPVSAERYYFDAAMDNIVVDASGVTLTKKENGYVVSGVTAGYDANKGLVYVDLPKLNYITEYVLTFAASSVISNNDTYGALAMADDFVVEFTTVEDAIKVKSAKFVNADGNELTANTLLGIGDTVKAQVVLSNKYEDNGDYIVILVLYDEFGGFYDVAFKEGVVVNSDGDVTITTDAITVDKANISAAVMVWKNWIDISPRAKKVVYPAQ